MEPTEHSKQNQRGLNKGLILCQNCGHVNESPSTFCCCCQHQISIRKPHNLIFSWAWLLTATFLIFPANIFPITITTRFGIQTPDTIFSGVISLQQSGMWAIAIVVFVASIIVPIGKICILSYIFALASGLLSAHALTLQRINKLFHVIHWVGRWSMLDLFVIAIMGILLNLEQNGFDPGPATIPFGLVVICTMFAANSFDPRLLWDKYYAR